MAQQGRWTLTEAQRKTLEEASAVVHRAFEQAHAKLVAAGVRGAGSLACGLCGCEEFLPGAPLGQCKRASCRHVLLAHDLPV